MGKNLDDVLRLLLDLPTHHGEINDLDMWYFEVNARMHSVDVATGIGTSIYLLVMVNCIIAWCAR
jgi:hypothetical protein